MFFSVFFPIFSIIRVAITVQGRQLWVQRRLIQSCVQGQVAELIWRVPGWGKKSSVRKLNSGYILGQHSSIVLKYNGDYSDSSTGKSEAQQDLQKSSNNLLHNSPFVVLLELARNECNWVWTGLGSFWREDFVFSLRYLNNLQVKEKARNK